MTINHSVTTMANFTDILRNEPKKAYDFISNYGHLFDKNELINIIKEFIYGAHVNLSNTTLSTIMNDIGVELDELYDEAYQED